MPDLQWRRYELLRMRWRLINGLTECDPFVFPAALDWLDGEIEALKKA